jgi:DNA modification methylase
MLHVYKSSPVDALTPYPGNARTHSEAQVEQIATSICEFGFTNPVLIDPSGHVIAGHGRLLAAKLLKMPTVPTLTLPPMTETQRRALILADNKLAMNAGWDNDKLRFELSALEVEGFDLEILGWSPEELADLYTVSSGGGDPNDCPSLRPVSRSQLGDCWVLGPHRVVVGDCREQPAWDLLMGKERADICWTDLPYNVDYESAAGKIQNDKMSASDFVEFLRLAFVGIYHVLKAGGACYVCHADTEGLGVRTAFGAAGFKLSGCLIWKKDALVLGRSDYQWIHEPILYGWKPGAKHRWHGGRKNTTITELGAGSPFTALPDGRWQVTIGNQMFIVDALATVEQLVPSLLEEPRPKRSTEHPTMKPVELVERMLINSSRAGDIVVDPFGGAGSTLVAAERLNMSARLMELDPHYADVIIRRWQALSGRSAVRAGSDETFGD